jgi:hypothetical protein
MSSPDNSPDDPYLRALIAIGAELTAIRQALEAMGEAEPETDSQPTTQSTYRCRSCGATVPGDGAARQHAVSEHSAPPETWSDIMIPVDTTTTEENRHAH